MKRLWMTILCVAAAGALAEEKVEKAAASAATNAAPARAARVVVLLPEQIDAERFWYYFTDTAQHLVQSAVEKELVRAGVDVIDVSTLSLQGSSLADLGSTDGAAKVGGAAKADYVILGKATAMSSGENRAYGVSVARSSAEITARIVRIADGKVVAVEEASAQGGGQSQRAAGQDALKKASEPLARKLAKAVPPPP